MCNIDIWGFVDILQGHDVEWSPRVVESWDESRVIVDSTQFIINTNMIKEAIRMRNFDLKHSKK